MRRIAKSSAVVFLSLLVGNAQAEFSHQVDLDFSHQSSENKSIQDGSDRAHNDFGFRSAAVTVTGEKDGLAVKLVLDAAAGLNDRSGDNNADGTTAASSNNVELPVANLTYSLSDALSISAGRFFSPARYESYFARDNFNYSRSWAWNNLPVFAEGLALNYSHDSGFSAAVFFLDGLAQEGSYNRNVDDNNQAKTYGVKLAYARDSYDAYIQHHTGREGGAGSTNKDAVTVTNVGFTWKIDPKATVGFSYDAFALEDGNTNAKESAYTAMSLYGQYLATEDLRLALRYEMFEDDSDNGATVLHSTGTYEDEITSITLTAGYALNANSEIIGEVKMDESDKKAFTDYSATTNQATDEDRIISLAWVYRM